MSSENQARPAAADADPARPGDGLPDDVEPAPPAEPAGAAAGEDGVPDGLAPEEEAVAEAVAAEDAAAGAADPDGAPPVDGDAAGGIDATADADAGEPGVAEAAPEEPDWHDRYLRAAAELENVRRRARRDVAAGEARGVGRVARELLPAIDDLDRAVQHLDEAGADAPAGDDHLVTAVRTVHQSLSRALERVGIEIDRPEGEPFDPHRHEALTQQPAPEGVEPGTIVAVYQAGYRRGDDVLRAAKVVVAG